MKNEKRKIDKAGKTIQFVVWWSSHPAPQFVFSTEKKNDKPIIDINMRTYRSIHIYICFWIIYEVNTALGNGYLQNRLLWC